MNQKQYMLLGGGLVAGWLAGWYFGKKQAVVPAGQLYPLPRETMIAAAHRGTPYVRVNLVQPGYTTPASRRASVRVIAGDGGSGR